MQPSQTNPLRSSDRTLGCAQFECKMEPFQKYRGFGPGFHRVIHTICERRESKIEKGVPTEVYSGYKSPPEGGKVVEILLPLRDFPDSGEGIIYKSGILIKDKIRNQVEAKRPDLDLKIGGFSCCQKELAHWQSGTL